MTELRLIFLFLFCSIFSIAQTEVIDQDIYLNQDDFKDNIEFGFSLGANVPYLDVEGLPENSRVKNLSGLEMGLFMHYKMSDRFSISPKFGLTFYKSEVLFANNDNNVPYSVLPIGINLMTHFNIRRKADDNIPYIFFGPNYKISVDNIQDSREFPTRNNLCLEVGLGFSKDFYIFDFAPELKYSYGTTNINANPLLKSVYMHTFSFTFNFKG